jgi:SAM-dependent methyltransferase
MREPAFLSDTRAAYDTVAATYAERVSSELGRRPLDRALLNAFAEMVLQGGGGSVADIGCGPGHLTDYLHQAGLRVSGLDLSPAMVAEARRLYPHLNFEQASMTALPLEDGALAALVAWYSTIHLPTERLSGVFAEFHRVLAPGGLVVLAFQAGHERVHLEQAYGHAVSVVAYRRPPDQVAELLDAAGLACSMRMVRQPDPDEKVPQAYLLARRGEPE